VSGRPTRGPRASGSGRQLGGAVNRDAAVGSPRAVAVWVALLGKPPVEVFWLVGGSGHARSRARRRGRIGGLFLVGKPVEELVGLGVRTGWSGLGSGWLGRRRFVGRGYGAATQEPSSQLGALKRFGV